MMEGTYGLYIHFISWSLRSALQLLLFLRISAASSTPLIEAEEGHGVVLQCPPYPGPDVDLFKSSVTWSKDEENNIIYACRRGHDLANDQKKEFRNRTSLDHEGLRKGNASLWLSSLRLSDSGTYICYIRMLNTYYFIDLKVVESGQLFKPQGISPTMTAKAETPDGENGTGYVIEYTVIIFFGVLGSVILILGTFMTCKKIQEKMEQQDTEMQTLSGGHQTNCAGNIKEVV